LPVPGFAKILQLSQDGGIDQFHHAGLEGILVQRMPGIDDGLAQWAGNNHENKQRGEQRNSRPCGFEQPERLCSRDQGSILVSDRIHNLNEEYSKTRRNYAANYRDFRRRSE
jgi:hypothetical protein